MSHGVSSRSIKVSSQGTHRVRSPKETVRLLEPHFDAVGITRVSDITGLDDIGIPTVLVTRPDSRSLSVSQGKGANLDAARASGVMESVEQFHAERAELPLLRASYAELLQRHAVVDVDGLPGYLRPFDVGARLLWTRAAELGSAEHVFVPYELVHLDLALPLPENSGFFPIGSNGLASGNTLAEAIAHGLWEVVERDSLALFFAMPADMQALRRLDLSTVDDEVCVELLQRYRAASVRVGVWDMTSDIGVAAFYCGIVEDEWNPFRRIGKACGYGCHLDRGVALARALTEAAQSRLTRISGARDDIQIDDFERIRSESAIRRHQAELAPPPSYARRFEQVPHQSFDSFDEDLEFTTAALTRAGLARVLSVDLSRAEFPVAVARVIVPGLEGHPEVPGYLQGRRARAMR